MADIFLSYASEDRERVRPLVERLEARGWSVWWDRDIPLGGSWPELIEEGLAHCRIMVVVWSEASVSSKWVRIEAREGAARGQILPLLLDRVRPPLEFTETQAADLIGWAGGEHPGLSELFSAISSVLEAEPQPDTDDHVHEPSINATNPYRSRRSLIGAFVAIVAAFGLWQFVPWDSAPAPPPIAVAVLAPITTDSLVPPSIGEILHSMLEGAFVSSPEWNLVSFRSVAALEAERALDRSGRADGSMDTTRVVYPSHALTVIVEGMTTTAPEDSLSFAVILFEVGTGRLVAAASNRVALSRIRDGATETVARIKAASRARLAADTSIVLERVRVEAELFGGGLAHLTTGHVSQAAGILGAAADAYPDNDALGSLASATAPFHKGPGLPGVAVMDFSVYSDDEAVRGLGAGVAGMIRVELSHRDGFRVLERQRLSVWVSETDSSESGDFQAGRIVSVRYFITGTVLLVGDSIDIEVQVVDAETQVTESRFVHRALRVDLFEAIVTLADRLLLPSSIPAGAYLDLATALRDLGYEELADLYEAMEPSVGLER